MEVNQKKASELARAGFDMWEAGRLEEAVPLYREALECADPDHYALDGYHSELAAVLAILGRDQEAREHYELALATVQRIDGEAESPAVLIARYFLAEHLVRMNAPAEALAIIEPASFAGSRQDCPLRTVQAKALWRLNRRDESRVAADAALAGASSERQRNRIREDLAFILGPQT